MKTAIVTIELEYDETQIDTVGLVNVFESGSNNTMEGIKHDVKSVVIRDKERHVEHRDIRGQREGIGQ